MKKIRSNRLLSGITILELLALLFCMILYIRPMESVVINADSVTAPDGAVRMDSLMNDTMPGWYVDNSIDMPEGKLTLVTSPVNLHFGSFNVTLKYATNDETNTYSAISTYNTWPVNTGHSDTALSAEFSAESGCFDDMCNTRSNATYRLDSIQNVDGYQVCFNYAGNGYLYVNGIEIHETNSFKNAFLFWTIALYLLFLVFYTVLRRHKDAGKYAVILAGLFLLSSLPLTGTYLKNGHDLPFHLARIDGMVAAISDGQFPVRLSYLWNSGYGYATSVFYSDFFLIIPALLRMIGMTVQGAYKVYVLVINAATCLIAFACFEKIFHDRKASVLGAVAYALLPYRICCVYVRAAVGEYTAMAFFPLIIFGMYELYQESDRKRERPGDMVIHSLPLVVGMSALIESHVLSCVIAMLFIVIVALICWKRTFTPLVLKRVVTAVVMTLLLNLWFITPFLEYMQGSYAVNQMTNLGSFAANAAFPWQIFSFLPGGLGIAYTVAEGVNADPEMSYSIGGGMTIALALWAYIMSGKKAVKNREYKIYNWSFWLGILFICFAMIWFPWDSVQQLGGVFAYVTQSMQYPFRFLGIAGALLAVLCGGIIVVIRNSDKIKHLYMPIVAVLLSFCLISGVYEIDNIERNGTWGYYVNDNSVNMNAISNGEYIPTGTDKEMFGDDNVYAGEGSEIIDSSKTGGTLEINCLNSSSKESYVDVPFLYYKGYKAIDEDSRESLDVTSGEGMRVRVILPSGYSGVVRIIFSEPVIWKISEALSIASLILLIEVIMKNIKKQLVTHEGL